MLKRVWRFIKSPDGIQWRHASLDLKLKVLLHLLVLGLVLGMSMSLIIGWLTEILKIDLGPHASQHFFEKSSALTLLFFAVIMAPVLEELVFRGPLSWFREKTYFKYTYYASIILFGYVHLLNFDLFKEILILSPILVGPQLILGSFLGYVRVKMGLGWAIILHASHNAVLLVPILMMKLANLPLE